MIIADIIKILESVAPIDLQEDYDNCGLIIGNASTEVTGVLTCLDSTPDIVQEAKQKGCNLIVAHHPIIFRGIKQLNGKNYIENTVIEAIKNDIAIYAIHTNLDNILKSGVNQVIAQKLGLQDLKILKPKNDQNKLIGAGMIGSLAQPLSETDFLALVKSKMGTGVIKHTQLLNKKVNTVALCGGSGSFLLDHALASNADFFVTSDFKYHEFFDANNQIVIADIGHYESEQYTIELIASILKENFSNFATHCTELNTNPVNYYH